MRWQKVLLIPCAVLAAASLQAGRGQAESDDLSPLTEALEVASHRATKGPGDRSRHGADDRWQKLTEVQRQALFKARRDWELRSYPQRLALLKNQQRCTQDAASLEAYRRCRRQHFQARRALREQGRAVINDERARLGLEPLPPRRPWHHHHQKGRS